MIPSGNVIYKVLASYLNEIEGIIQTDDGGIIVESKFTAGNTSRTIPADKTYNNQEITLTPGSVVLVKYDEYGLVEWAKYIFSNRMSASRECGELDEMDNGGYIMTFYTTTDMLVPAENMANGKAWKAPMKTLNTNIIKFNKDNKIEYITDTNKFVTTTDRAMKLSTHNNYINLMANSKKIAQFQESRLFPSVPETKVLQVQNIPLSYQITTEVKGEGGTISGQGEIKYEEVPYKEDSRKDIIVTPETGYQILSIKVNGEKIQFTPNTDGTVTLNKFISMTSNKHVEVEFTKAGTSALVHHYLLGTGEEYGNEAVKLAENEYISGEIGQAYKTTPKVDLAKYEIVTNKDYYKSINQLVPEGVDPEDYYIPSNSAGVLEENQIVVNYYYKERTYKLTVHHYLEGLTEKVPAKEGGVVEDEITENLAEGYAYKTQNAIEQGKVDRKYKLVMVEGNETGKITGDTEVTYYYKNTAIDITVNKTWEDGNTETRPTEIPMVLTGTTENKTEVYHEEIILTQANNWTYTWEQLYTEDETGKEITYKVEEKEVPEGYYISNQEKQENTYTITNSKKGRITITKVDKKDKTKRLSGAEFRLEKLKQKEDGTWEVDNEFMAQIKETGEEGLVEYTNLKHGKYRITETKAPEGYELNTKPQEIEINANQIDYEIEIQDKLKTELPTAGGRGIYLNILIGVIIVLGGVSLSKKKSKIEKVQYKKK